MKKILTILGATGFVVTAGMPAIQTTAFSHSINLFDERGTLINFNLNQNNDSEVTSKAWESIDLSHKVSVPAAGTHTKDEIKVKSKSTAKLDFELIKNAKYSVVYGNFELRTWKEPKYPKEILLEKIENESSNDTVVFRKTITNDKWAGWGHQTSIITPEVTAVYNEEEGITTLTLKSYIYIRTAGSVHVSWTSASYDSVTFLTETKK